MQGPKHRIIFLPPADAKGPVPRSLFTCDFASRPFSVPTMQVRGFGITNPQGFRQGFLEWGVDMMLEMLLPRILEL